MRWSSLREPLRYFVFYAVSGILLLPCAIAFAYLKTHNYGSLSSLPILIGVIGGLALIGWLEHRGKSPDPAPQSILFEFPLDIHAKAETAPVVVGSVSFLRATRVVPAPVRMRTPLQFANSMIIERVSLVGVNPPAASTKLIAFLL